jgi:hypothetical protein
MRAIYFVFLHQIQGMIKLILLALAGYLAYRFYLAPLLNPPASKDSISKQSKGTKPSAGKDEEYIDYEELK